MAGEIKILRAGAFGTPGTAASIKAGQLCLKTPGSAFVVAWDASNTAKPVVGTDYLAGLALSTSTETAAAVGYVEVLPIVQGQVLLGNPTTAATWDTQAEYDALVGDRVLLRTSAAGLQTLEPTDGATYGLIIEPLDLSQNPGQVAFSIHPLADYHTDPS